MPSEGMPPESVPPGAATPVQTLPEATAPPARRRARMLLLGLVPALVALGAGGWYLSQQRYASTDNAYVKSDKALVSAEVEGVVRRRLVEENERVIEGQPLLELDDEERRIAVLEAEARLRLAETQVATLKAQYVEKQSELAVARREADFADRELARQRELAARRLVAVSLLDEAERGAELAHGRVRVLESDLAALSAGLGGDPARPVAQYPAARAAAAELEQARLALRRSVIRAPREGIVSHLPQVGDRLAPDRAALAIVSDRDAWIEANFKETDLAEVREGQPVRIEIDTYGRRAWRGRVVSVAQATGAEFAILPAQNASGNWIKTVQRIPVRIAVETRPGDPPLRAGMSAEVRIDTRGTPEPSMRTARSGADEPGAP